MDKIRICFKRGESLKYLSHLDQQRLFQRTFRRAKLPIAYSQGFHPHPIISFASAMKVGMTSDEEYVDVSLNFAEEALTETEIKKRLNQLFPSGISVLNVSYLDERTPSLSRSIKFADYEICCVNLHVGDFDNFSKELEKFNEQESLIIETINKKGKRKEREIRHLFENIITKKEGKNVLFYIRVFPENGSFLSPEIFIKNFLAQISYFNEKVQIETHKKRLGLESS